MSKEPVTTLQLDDGALHLCEQYGRPWGAEDFAERSSGGSVVDVKRLPGNGCRHHVAGHCLYEEHLNPGYASQWRCRVMMRWESAFDDFLVRAESFGVEQSAAPALWTRQFERMAREAFDCEQYAYCHGAEAPACAHALDAVCRLSLPQCEGRCRHFHLEELNAQNDLK